MQIINERQDDWSAQWREEGLQQGLEQGLEHERELVSRQAARKFGASIGERLVPLMDQIQEPDRMLEIGEWVIDCDSAEDLLKRTQHSVASD